LSEYLSIIILIASIVYFFYALSKKGIEIKDLNSIIRNGMRESDSNSANKKKNSGFHKFKMLFVHINMALFILMFLTSFLPTSFTGGHLTGLFLIIHITLAPLFSLSLATLILIYSYELKLNYTDFVNSREWLKNNNKNNRKYFISYIKILFWLLTIISIPLLLSIILSFFPITGIEWQNFYLVVHRISALIFTLAILGLIYFLVNLLKNNS